MTKDEIIRMAREAGAERNSDFPDWSFEDDTLERFVALVAAAEREACANVCDGIDQDGNGWDCANAIRARGESVSALPAVQGGGSADKMQTQMARKPHG
jgi:hypothetical protein